jgi:hypothetical protein
MFLWEFRQQWTAIPPPCTSMKNNIRIDLSLR